MEKTLRLLTLLITGALVDDAEVAKRLALLTAEGVPWQSIYSVSKAHDVAHYVAKSIDKYKIPVSAEIKERFTEQLRWSVYRHELLSYDYEKISDTLESAGIDFLPLKGTVIRSLYPEPWLRTSCDIDILVKEQDMEIAKQKVMNGLKYSFDYKTTHDIMLRSPSNTSFEMHFDLIEDEIFERKDKYLDDVWSNALPCQGFTHKKALDNETFYYYIIMHMAKHVLNGGCGMRPFIDIFILDKNLPVDTERLESMLKTGGIYNFWKKAKELTYIWFGAGTHNEISKEFERYIIKAGQYGKSDNGLAVQHIKKGKRRVAWKMIWLPYINLKIKYPSLKSKWLIPFYQVRRWCGVIFLGKSKGAINKLKKGTNVSEDKKQEIITLLKNIGLLEN